MAVLVKAAFLPSQSAEDGQADTSDEADKTITIVSTSELPTEIPTAYPLIQPMKAAFHFDSVDGFGEWRIRFCSEEFSNCKNYPGVLSKRVGDWSAVRIESA